MKNRQLIQALIFKRKAISFSLLLIFISFGSFSQKVKKGALTEERRKIAAEKEFIEGEKHFLLEDYTKALGYFMSALENSPDNHGILYKIGEIYLKNKEYNNAENFASRALNLNKQNKYYYLLLGEIYNKQFKYKQAAELYEEMIQRLPKTEEYLLDLATLYLYNNNFTKALETYGKVEAHYGYIPEVAFAKQKIYLKNNQLDKAIAEGRALIEKFPGVEKYVVNLAQILVSNNRLDEAIEILEELNRKNPTLPESRFLLSNIYKKKGNESKYKEHLKVAFESSELNVDAKIQLLAGFVSELPNKEIEVFAEELAKKTIENHPEKASPYVIYGDILLKVEKKEEALGQYLKAIEVDNSNFNIWLNILQLELALNKQEELLKHSEEALELYPNQAVVYFYIGMAKVIKKEYEEAVQSLLYGKRLAKKDENLKSAFNGQLGEAYSALKQYDKSDNAFEEVLAHNPNNYPVLNNYSYYLALRKEKLDLAKEMSSRLIKSNPENVTYLDTHAWVLYVLKEYKEASKHLEKAIKSGRASGTIIEHYGDVLFRLGKVDKAIEQWEKAKGMDGKSEFIDKKIADRKLYE